MKKPTVQQSHGYEIVTGPWKVRKYDTGKNSQKENGYENEGEYLSGCSVDFPSGNSGYHDTAVLIGNYGVLYGQFGLCGGKLLSVAEEMVCGSV